MLLIFALAGAAIFAFDGANTQPLNPDPAHEAWGWATGITLGALCFVAMIGAKTSTGRPVLMAIVMALVVAGSGFPITVGVLDQLEERATFANVPITRHVETLSIESASIHHGKGGLGYEVWLTHDPVLLQIDEADYRAAFGKADRVHPDGYCVRVIVETAGKSSRVLATGGFGLPRGSLVHCR